MKYKYLVLSAILLLFVFWTAGCSTNNQNQNLAICGTYAVPGMHCPDLKGHSYKCEVLEKDSQGRILYKFEAENVITDQWECAAVICQSVESDKVWYYEDICYLFSNWTDDDLVLLKETNDWNQPLDYSKMVSRSNKVTLDGWIADISTLDFQSIKEQVSHNIGISEEQIKDHCFLDRNNAGMDLYWFVVSTGADELCYYVLVDSEYHIATLQTENSLHSLQSLIEFKNINGW